MGQDFHGDTFHKCQRRWQPQCIPVDLYETIEQLLYDPRTTLNPTLFRFDLKRIWCL
jgi:hypothetical protein